jgi:predicted CXXCH cytochrome family protein
MNDFMRYLMWVVATIALVLLFYFGMAMAAVKDTPHRLDGTNGVAVPNQEVCRPCHTPHNASTEVGYLWNHELSQASWTLHEDADQESVLSSSSRLCLSCHDGTVAIDSYGGLSGFNYMAPTDKRNLGVDLSNDHPIGVSYPTDAQNYNQPNASGHIVDSVETPTGQHATLEDGMVQCSSCHMAHGSNADYGMFLRVDNTGSRLCMTCHIK